jgi:hypothetical protein
VCRRNAGGEQTKEIYDNVQRDKDRTFAAIILSAALSAVTASYAGAVREQARSSGTGVPAYDRDGGIVSSNWH